MVLVWRTLSGLGGGYLQVRGSVFVVMSRSWTVESTKLGRDYELGFVNKAGSIGSQL